MVTYKIAITKEIAMNLNNSKSQIINIEQGTPEWLELRKGKVTGTLISKLNTETGYKQFMGLDNFKGNKHTERGNYAESFIRDLVNARTNHNFKEVVVQQEKMLGSLDGLSEDGEVVLEIKCPENEESSLYNKVLEGNVPVAHLLQMQFYMLLTGAKKAIYAVALLDDIGLDVKEDSLVILEVLADSVYFQGIMIDIEIFLNNIEKGEYQQISAPQGFDKLAEDYIVAKDKESAVKKEVKDLGDTIKAHGVINACGISVSKTSGRTTTDWKSVAIELFNQLSSNDLTSIEDFNKLQATHTKKGEDNLTIRINKGE